MSHREGCLFGLTQLAIHILYNKAPLLKCVWNFQPSHIKMMQRTSGYQEACS